MTEFRRATRLSVCGLAMAAVGTGLAWAQSGGSGAAEVRWLDHYGFPVAALLLLGSGMWRVWRFLSPLLQSLAEKHFAAVDALTQNADTTSRAITKIEATTEEIARATKGSADALARFGELLNAHQDQHHDMHRKLDVLHGLIEELRKRERL